MKANITYLPCWTKRAVIDGSGRDPLGLSRVSDNFTGLLMPSIITTTSRARYYSFYAWALRDSGERLAGTPYVKKRCSSLDDIPLKGYKELTPCFLSNHPVY